MSISSTVATLASSLASHVAVTTPDLLPHLAKLAQMPEAVARQRLDQWEESLAEIRRDKERIDREPAYAAMITIFELGRLNLYAEIDDELTDEYFSTARDALVSLGVSGVPARADVDLSDW